MNIIGITGNITRDLELKHTESGKAVTAFCVAVKRPHTSDKTDFIDCVAWGQKAEFITKYFAKGSGIAITGYLSTRTWEDKEGNKRKVTEVICDDVGFMGGKKSEGQSASSYSAPSIDVDEMTEIDGDDDLPF